MPTAINTTNTIKDTIKIKRSHFEATHYFFGVLKQAQSAV
jgi:hypothetical protein